MRIDTVAYPTCQVLVLFSTFQTSCELLIHTTCSYKRRRREQKKISDTKIVGSTMEFPTKISKRIMLGVNISKP